jgi:polysaccharide biosynthesis/export protein
MGRGVVDRLDGPVNVSEEMMRTAILFAVVAIVSQVRPAAAAQEQKTAPEEKTPPAAQSPKVTIPVPGQPAADPAKMAAPVAPGGVGSDKDYVIGAEDILNVLVWNNRELTNQVVVRPDGRITVGLIGEMQAVGQTPERLGKEIADKLKEGGYLRSPQVQVSVQQINSKKFYINGEVNKPGTYNLVVPTKVLEALVNAGGFRDFANKKDIRIVRGDKQFKFNYNRVIKGQNRDQNIYLEPGDIIIVK